MKKILAIILASILLCALPVFADDITVVIDGTAQSYDQPPIIINGRTMVPMRGIFEALGAEIAWDDATKTVTAIKGKIKIEITIGNERAVVNDDFVSLDSPAIIEGGRTLVPARFVSEAMGAAVEWDSATKTVNIKSAEMGGTLKNIWTEDFTGATVNSGEKSIPISADPNDKNIGWWALAQETNPEVSTVKIVDDPKDPSNKALVLSKMQKTPGLALKRSFNKLSAAVNGFTVTFRIMLDSDETEVAMDSNIAIGNDPVLHLVFTNSQNSRNPNFYDISYRTSGKGYGTIMTSAAFGDWVEIMFDCDFEGAGARSKIYVDGSLVGETTDTYGTDSGSSFKASISSGSLFSATLWSATVGNLYLDDISVSVK